MGSTIYFGAKNQNGKVDTSQDYTQGYAHFTGSTLCLGASFGDHLPEVSGDKYCFCDEFINNLYD